MSHFFSFLNWWKFTLCVCTVVIYSHGVVMGRTYVWFRDWWFSCIYHTNCLLIYSWLMLGINFHSRSSEGCVWENTKAWWYHDRLRAYAVMPVPVSLPDTEFMSSWMIEQRLPHSLEEVDCGESLCKGCHWGVIGQATNYLISLYIHLFYLCCCLCNFCKTYP